ncbi:MAG: hypothetical protein JJ863_21945 [Deltaproteobacteria bacterium]|nr:hypothetical protein [Deltaproteobacteria bacterium]
MYDASQIKVLTPLEAIRARPAMYIGRTGTEGLMEMVGGAVSYFLHGHRAGLTTTIDVSVEGDAADAPVRIRADGSFGELVSQTRLDRTLLELVFSSPRMGSDLTGFRGDPALPDGCVAPLAAVSSELEVEVCDGGDRHRLRGGDAELWGRPQRVGPSTERSMTIRYRADGGVLGAESYDLDALGRTLATVAALHPDLLVVFQGQRVGSGRGLAELHTGPLARPAQPIQAETFRERVHLRLSLGWRLDERPPSVRAFSDDDHRNEALVEGFHEGLLEALRAHVRADLPSADLRGGWGLGLDAVLHARVPSDVDRWKSTYEPVEPATVRACARDATHEAVAARIMSRPLFHAWLRDVFA